MDGKEWRNSKELQVRYVVHTACMLERILQGEVLPHKQAESMKEQFPEVFERLKRALFETEQTLHAAVPDSELAYLAEMLEECR